MPPAVPKEFADKLFTFHSNPFLWFVGQFLSYMMRPNEKLQQYIEKKKKDLKLPSPYVSIQVRRTDKVKEEAKTHDVDEYMVHIEDWFQLCKKDQYRQVDKKRVYIATDDPSVIKKAKEKYKDYEVFTDEEIVQSANNQSERFSLDSLFGMVYDLHMLAGSDFMVCTFTSNVGRLAYELMQTYHVDARQKGYSLDTGYYFHGQDPGIEVKEI
jgi:glycoprotein 6-alpha-L-fucosyltransferase